MKVCRENNPFQRGLLLKTKLKHLCEYTIEDVTIFG
jgi:hypothetical protein